MEDAVVVVVVFAVGATDGECGGVATLDFGGKGGELDATVVVAVVITFSLGAGRGEGARVRGGATGIELARLSCEVWLWRAGEGVAAC